MVHWIGNHRDGAANVSAADTPVPAMPSSDACEPPTENLETKCNTKSGDIGYSVTTMRKKKSPSTRRRDKRRCLLWLQGKRKKFSIPESSSTSTSNSIQSKPFNESPAPKSVTRKEGPPPEEVHDISSSPAIEHSHLVMLTPVDRQAESISNDHEEEDDTADASRPNQEYAHKEQQFQRALNVALKVGDRVLVKNNDPPGDTGKSPGFYEAKVHVIMKEIGVCPWSRKSGINYKLRPEDEDYVTRTRCRTELFPCDFEK